MLQRGQVKPAEAFLDNVKNAALFLVMASPTVDIAMERGARGVVLHHGQGGVPQPGGVAWPEGRTVEARLSGHLWSGPGSRPCAGRKGPAGGWQGFFRTSPWRQLDPGLKRAQGR